MLLLLNERGEWDLPGGRPDPGEDHRAALAREVREETGLAVEVGAALDEHLFEVLPGRFVRILPFACRLVGSDDVVLSHEHLETRWVPLAELGEIDRRPSVAGGLSRRDTPGDRPAALAQRPGGLNREEPVVRRGGAEPELVPGIEGFQRIGKRELAHGAPAGLASR